MSNIFQNLLTPNRRRSHLNSGSLPSDFAESILQNDMKLVMSQYADKDALQNLIQLYMVTLVKIKKGVEYYEQHKDPKQEYFKAKLQWLMNHPQLQVSQVIPQINNASNSNKLEFKVHKLEVNEIAHYQYTPQPESSSANNLDQSHEIQAMIDNLKLETESVNQVLTQLQQIIQSELNNQSHQIVARLNKRNRTIAKLRQSESQSTVSEFDV